MAKIEIECDVGEVSDGFHTFNELYAHRCSLFAVLMKSHPQLSWISKTKQDGSIDDGWFVAGMNLPSGLVSYNLPLNPFWDILSDINQLETAPDLSTCTSMENIKKLLMCITNQ